jgi:REP element-mobilizing transposase RayT
MNDRYKISPGCVYNINYHLVWCPKYRKPVLTVKGYTSHELRNKYEHLRKKLPTLWSRSYYVGTAGFVSDTVIKNYIANQNGK